MKIMNIKNMQETKINMKTMQQMTKMVNMKKMQEHK